MPITTSTVLKSTSAQTLGALSSVLKKGADHAASLKIPEDVFLGFRLYPDMFPLTRQVQIACDQVTRGSARLAGADLPSFPDTETTFAQLQDRITKANAFCQAQDSAAIDKRTDTTISVPIGPGQEMSVTCGQFLLGMILPNLYFHSATAYDILRHNGVVLGKRDFLRPAG
ncbi:MAG: DUF1993 family protein [Alphaproteobacteria bacterium]|nr:DUF1993 family protein [Alphaproteobacteria bacterium]